VKIVKASDIISMPVTYRHGTANIDAKLTILADSTMDVKHWHLLNRLQLNADKSESLLVGTANQLEAASPVHLCPSFIDPTWSDQASSSASTDLQSYININDFIITIIIKSIHQQILLLASNIPFNTYAES